MMTSQIHIFAHCFGTSTFQHHYERQYILESYLGYLARL